MMTIFIFCCTSIVIWSLGRSPDPDLQTIFRFYQCPIKWSNWIAGQRLCALRPGLVRAGAACNPEAQTQVPYVVAVSSASASTVGTGRAGERPALQEEWNCSKIKQEVTTETAINVSCQKLCRRCYCCSPSESIAGIMDEATSIPFIPLVSEYLLAQGHLGCSGQPSSNTTDGLRGGTKGRVG